jgi:hypothetical protein
MLPAVTKIVASKARGELNPAGVLELTRRALEDRGIYRQAQLSRNLGVFVATTLSNIGIRERNCRAYLACGTRAVNPAEFPQGLVSYLGGYLSIDCEAKGINSTVSSGASSSLDALSQAQFFLKRNPDNKAIIVELSEVIQDNSVCLIEESVCVLLENAVEGSRRYADIVALASYFDEEGSCQGLKKSIQSVFARHPLDPSHIYHIVTPLPVGSGEYSLIEEAVTSSGLSLATGISHSNSGSKKRYPLAVLASFCEGSGSGKSEKVKPAHALFLHLGSNSNSSCLVLNIPVS